MRAVNMNYTGLGVGFLHMPAVPGVLEIPKPFAIAVQRLGAVGIQDLTVRRIVVPAAAATDSATWLLDSKTDWSPSAYSRAVGYARSLGMQFSAVDTRVKAGSSWWLYSGSVSSTNGAYMASMVFPETNYDEENAPLHTMFCCRGDGSIAGSVFQLDAVSEGHFGTMLRRPPPGFHSCTFFGYSDKPLRSLWKQFLPSCRPVS
ncbi:hypothetical protein BS78_03G061000 [Paspalum vaginatum]|nr:hypothetical protein BS78_03G061000 [Paspalum vaginatum]